MPDNSKFYQDKKRELADQMRFYQEQRRRFSNQIRQYEEGQKLLEEENYKILEEQMERERERELLKQNQKKYDDSFGYKDTGTKTFYTEYVQQKYKIADGSFPNRNTYTINIRNSEMNSNKNSLNLSKNYSFKDISNKVMCPGCGKYIVSNVGGNFSYVKVNHLCPGCGKLKKV